MTTENITSMERKCIGCDDEDDNTHMFKCLILDDEDVWEVFCNECLANILTEEPHIIVSVEAI